MDEYYIAVVYLLQMTYPRLEFIYHPCGYIEEVCALQLLIPHISHDHNLQICTEEATGDLFASE